MRYMVRRYGIRDAKGRRSFRHTIRGKSDLFRVVNDAGQVIVRPVKGNGPVPYWAPEELVAAGAKLRRLLLVKGERQGQSVRFLYADAYETFHLADFVYELVRGTIALDFDCREMTPGSDGLRNHGTKFRIPPLTVCRLYLKKERLYLCQVCNSLPLRDALVINCILPVAAGSIPYEAMEHVRRVLSSRSQPLCPPCRRCRFSSRFGTPRRPSGRRSTRCCLRTTRVR